MSDRTKNRKQNISASEQNPEADFAHAPPCDLAALTEKVRADRLRRENLVRPHISVGRAVCNVVFPLLVASGVFCLLYFLLPAHRLAVALCVSLGLLGVYIVVRFRALLIWCIRVYQATAPEEVRLRCVFTPSCSEYAVLALQKYGVLRGVPKIIGRLRRCHPPNGGKDDLP